MTCGRVRINYNRPKCLNFSEFFPDFYKRTKEVPKNLLVEIIFLLKARIRKNKS